MREAPLELPPRQRCPLCREDLSGSDAAARVACEECETVYHRACARELGGCSTMGCAGAQLRAAPRQDALKALSATPEAAVAAPGVRPLRLVASVLASWLLFPLFAFSWPLLIGFSALAVQEGRRARQPRLWGWLAALATSMVLVPTLSFLGGVSGYVTGTGRLRGVGLPGPEYSNIDPELRCRRTSSGCFVHGYELLTHLPNNFALRALIRLMGPMPGSYRGPLPAREDAFGLLRNARPLTPRELARNAVVADGLEFPLPAAFDERWQVVVLSGSTGRCAILVGELGVHAPHEVECLVFDLDGGELLARYRGDRSELQQR